MKKILVGLSVIIAIAGIYKYYILNSHQIIHKSEPIALGNISESFFARGKISLSDKVNIGAQVSGQITVISVKAGDHVNKDDILVEIDPTLQRNELKKTQANLNVVDAQIAYKNQQIEMKKIEIKRRNIIYKLEGVSREDIDKLKLELNGLQSEYNVLQSQRIQFLLERDNAQANLSYTVIKAPTSGMVLQISAKVGQTIISSQTSPTLLVIGSPSDMLVNVQVSETDINKIHKGLALKYSLLSYPDQEYNAEVETIDFLPVDAEGDKENYSSSQNNAPVYYNVRFRIKDVNRIFIPGLSVKVRFVLNEKNNVITVPNNYIISDKDTLDNSVYILKNKNPFKKKITIGINDDFNTEVVDGLNIGERLITSMRSHSKLEGAE